MAEPAPHPDVIYMGRSDLLIQMTVFIIALPFVTAVILLFLRLYELRKGTKLSENFTGAIGVGSLGLSWIASLYVMFKYFADYVTLGEHASVTKIQADYRFIPQSGAPLKWGVLLDPLSIIFLVVLTTIASSIHLYSMGYMHKESGYTRFFGTMNFFTGSMLGFVMASNLFMAFIFWELLGFSSYLLIGYYWEKPSASAAAKKAFLYNKVGDVAFVFGIALLYHKMIVVAQELGTRASLDYVDIQRMIVEGHLKFSDVWIPAMLIFGAAIGKSAQFPLFGWLPEAMEGPTPVSSLLHSSTMVKAGLFLIARNFFLYYRVDPETLHVILTKSYEYSIVNRNFHPVNFVTWIGVITALAGGLMALTTRDIKRVLAFSTISQLGYIAAAIGAGGLAAGFYHMIAHATFKSLLFLCAGSVIHAVHSQEYDDMGGLHEHMPWTSRTMFVGLLGLSGFPFMSGFWSKDAVLLAIKENDQVYAHNFAWFLGVLTAAITAFYSAKMYILTFMGEGHWNHLKDHGEHGDGEVKPHESGPFMVIPLIILGSLVLFESIWWSIGTLGFKNSTTSYMNFEEALGSTLGVHGGKFAWGDAAWGIIFVAIGYLLAFAIYYWKVPALVSFKTSSIVTPVEKVIRNRFGLDIFLYWVAENPVMMVGDAFQYVDKQIIDRRIIEGFAYETVAMKGSVVSDEFDNRVIDNIVDWVGLRFRDLGFMLRNLQKGKTPLYARLMSTGVLIILLIFTYMNFLK